MGYRIDKINKYFGMYKDRNIVVIGSGATLKDFQGKLLEFIVDNDCIVIGVNNMTSIATPHYHLWSNNKRFDTFKNGINDDSALVLCYSEFNGIKEENRNSIDRGYYQLEYIDHKDFKIQYQDEKLIGYFRTCGCLSIYFAHLLGAKNIYIAGMDGYSLVYNGDQHCYGNGYTDSDDIKSEKEKDTIINSVLQELKNLNINFKIITPTIYKDFYDSSILATDSKRNNL